MEYVFKLAKWSRETFPEDKDAHLFGIEAALNQKLYRLSAYIHLKESQSGLRLHSPDSGVSSDSAETDESPSQIRLEDS